MAQPSRCRLCVPTAFVHFEVQCQYATIQFLLACLHISGFLKRGCSSLLESDSRYGAGMTVARLRELQAEHQHAEKAATLVNPWIRSSRFVEWQQLFLGALAHILFSSH